MGNSDVNMVISTTGFIFSGGQGVHAFPKAIFDDFFATGVSCLVVDTEYCQELLEKWHKSAALTLQHTVHAEKINFAVQDHRTLAVVERGIIMVLTTTDCVAAAPNGAAESSSEEEVE